MNREGFRQVWETPLFDYTKSIGEEYDKARAAVMKHTNNDVAETTRILDIDAELDLLEVYRSWVGGQMYNAMMQETGPDHVSEQSIFFAGLNEEIWRDLKEMVLEFQNLQIGWRQASEGQHQVVHENGPYLSRNRSACGSLAVEK